MTDSECVDLREDTDEKPLFDYGDDLKDANLVSTGLHGIQISSDGEDESSRPIDVSAYLCSPCLNFLVQAFPRYAKLIEAKYCIGGSRCMGFELAQ